MRRRRLMRVTFGALLVLPAAWACGSFAGDQGPSTVDASAEDSAADGAGGEVEGAAAVDSGVADAAPTDFCKQLGSKPLLCADFDQDEPPGTGFDGLTGVVSKETKLALSPPGSLLAVGTSNHSYVHRDFSGVTTPKSFTISFAIRLGDEAGDGGKIFGIPVRLAEQSPTECSFEIIVTAADTRLNVVPKNDAGLPQNKPLVRILPFGRWATFRMNLANDVGGVRAEIDIDGQDALRVLTTCPALVGPPILYVGMFYGVGEQVRFDNVVFDAK